MTLAFLISIVVALVIFFVSGSTASFVMSFMTIFIGSLFALTVEKENRSYALKLFYIVFSVYTLLALFHYLDLTVDSDSFFREGKDELNLYLFSESYKSSSIFKIIRECFIEPLYKENNGYYFYIATIASVSTSWFDGNHLLLQFLGSTLFGSLTSILLFRLLSIYIDPKRAFRYSLMFLLFSAFNLYSVSLLRDIHIAFFYLWGFVIISKPFSVKGLIKLIIFTLIIWQLRIEHGIFFIFFILYYVYIKMHRYKLAFISLAVVLGVISFSFIMESYLLVEDTLDRYSEFSEEYALSKDDSVGTYIWSLPSPFRQIAIFMNSQIQPFPSWVELRNSTNVYRSIISILPIFYSLFWFIIFFSVVKWLILDRIYKNLEKNLILLLCIVFLFLIGNIVNMNIRRIMCVYPIIYLVYTVTREKYVSKDNTLATRNIAIFTYLLLIAVYFVIKA